MFDARGDEEPIQRGTTGREQGLAPVGFQPAMVGFVVGQPLGQAGHQAHAIGLQRCQPDRLERRQQFLRRVFPRPAADEGRAQRRVWASARAGRPSDGRRTVRQFTDPLGLVPASGAQVLPAHQQEDFLTGFWLIGVFMAW